MDALEWNVHERRLEWALRESCTWCESHEPLPLSQIILWLPLIKIHTRSRLWMPGLTVFPFDLAKDANAFTELESDCSGMQRTGTERHQGRFCFHLFSGDLKKEVLPYLSVFPHQIAPLLLSLTSIISVRNFLEKLGGCCFKAWYSSQITYTIIYAASKTLCFAPLVLPLPSSLLCLPSRFWPCSSEEKHEL